MILGNDDTNSIARVERGPSQKRLKIRDRKDPNDLIIPCIIYKERIIAQVEREPMHEHLLKSGP